MKDKQHYLDIIGSLEDVTISANTSVYQKEVSVSREYFTYMCDLKDLVEQVFNSSLEDTVVTVSHIDKEEPTVLGNPLSPHTRILNELSNIYDTKNTDYGNSFELDFEEFGMVAGIIPLGNKLRRIKQLNKNENQVKTESIEDSLLDLANYAILTLMEVRRKEYVRE